MSQRHRGSRGASLSSMGGGSNGRAHRKARQTWQAMGPGPPWWTGSTVGPPTLTPWSGGDGYWTEEDWGWGAAMMPPPHAMAGSDTPVGVDAMAEAAATTESLLSALAPDDNMPIRPAPHDGGATAAVAAIPGGGGEGDTIVSGPKLKGKRSGATKRSNRWLDTSVRPLQQQSNGFMSHEHLLGRWVDSSGNVINVLFTDAFRTNLVALLSKPPRPDIHLNVKPVTMGAGWQCGHSVLEPTWTTPAQLFWVTMDGEVSVWVRPPAADEVREEVEDELKPEDEKPGDRSDGSGTTDKPDTGAETASRSFSEGGDDA